MADDQSDSRALAPTRPNRPSIIVQSPAAIFDSGKFEHLYRVASVMAKAGLMPESLTHVRVGGGRGQDTLLQELSPDVVIARAFLIAAQADRWNMDPLALMNCCYLAHNKLGYEGRAVHAAIQSKLGITLDYDFGAYDPKTMRVQIGTTPSTPELLGIVVSATLPGETKPRSIEGYVGAWKYDFAGKELPAWKSPGSWPRMLRYRGAREWCNAHSPEVTLGVLTEDDFASPESPQIHFLEAPQERALDEAFGKSAKPAGSPRSPKGGPTPDETAKPRARETASPAPGVAAPSAKEESPLEGFAAPGVAYRMVGDGPNEHGAWPLYLQGRAVGLGQPDVAHLYSRHPPAEIVEFPGDRPRATTIDEERARRAPEADEDDGPADEVEGFDAVAVRIREANDWPQVKIAVDDLRAAPPEMRRNAMRLAYERTLELKPEVPEGDVTFFRLWLSVEGERRKETVRPAFRKLMKGAEYQALEGANRDLIVDEVNALTGD